MATYREIMARDYPRPHGRRHDDGTCGYMGSICGACWEGQVKLHTEAAQQITEPPHDGEDLGEWWRRVGGRFLDTWYAVASERYKQLSP